MKTSWPPLPTVIRYKGIIYNLKHTDFPDEENYNVSYASGGKWPRKRVLLQYSESSRERCVEKAWTKLVTLDYVVVKEVV